MELSEATISELEALRDNAEDNLQSLDNDDTETRNEWLATLCAIEYVISNPTVDALRNHVEARNELSRSVDNMVSALGTTMNKEERASIRAIIIDVARSGGYEVAGYWDYSNKRVATIVVDGVRYECRCPFAIKC